MQQKLLPEKEGTVKNGRKPRGQMPRLLAFVLALVMVFSLFPPMSARAAQCTLEEHAHSDSCYASGGSGLICDPVAQAYEGAAGEYADFVVHTHDGLCYDNGELICDLEEIQAHTHTDECYGEAGLHVHKEDCYQTYGLPQCGYEVHVHDADCYGYGCGLEETEAGHAHDASCYWNLTCQSQEEGHVHGDECYVLTATPACGQEAVAGHTHDPVACGQVLTCGLETNHTHNQSCYQILVCTKDTTKPDGEKQLICDEEEIILHTHGAGCYEITDSEQLLICDQEEVKLHVHSEACLSSDEESDEPICGLEEHTHTESCGVEEAEEPEELPENFHAGEDYPEGSENALEKSGFIQYWRDFTEKARKEEQAGVTGSLMTEYQVPIAMAGGTNELSDAQVVKSGGTTEVKNDGVKISKTVDGTDIENVFDITLTVESTHNLKNLVVDPDMAVVILMDISGTMLDKLDTDEQKLTMAAKAAAEFVMQFARNNTGKSKIGLAAFNTDAYILKGMQSCVGDVAAGSFNASMGDLLNKKANEGNTAVNNQKKSFTNIEGGLKAAYDMLNGDGINNENKYIIFLSDGVPTTYIKSGYTGYDPYTDSGTLNSKGVFYDDINNRYCPYGTNYSDKGAKLAASLASKIKGEGINIYPIGIGLNRFPGYVYSTSGVRGEYVFTQNARTLIQNQLYRGKNKKEASTIDCYDVSSINDLEILKPGSFVKWLETRIGSGWTVQDINDVSTLIAEYNKIFEDLIHISQEQASKLWIVEDPIPSDFEMLGFYNKSGSALQGSLSGSLGSNKEDTASVSNNKIQWNLQKSGYTYRKDGSKTIYQYDITYRVRLKNNASGFAAKEGDALNTNGTTSLKYATSTTTNGVTSWSDEKTLQFKIPQVMGYLGELTFTKKDNKGNALPGAEFTLAHSCTVNCRGNNTKLTTADIPDQVKTSGSDGKVTFTNIPSGHTYTLTETKTPHGYVSVAPMTVKVELDTTTVTGASIQDNVVENPLLETELEICGTKILTNPNGAPHSYTFRLTEVDSQGNPVENGESQTVTASWTEGDKETTKPFVFPDKLHFTGLDLNGQNSGKWYYRISEDGTDTDSLDKDERIYTVEVTVSVEGEGTSRKLTAQITDIAAENGDVEENSVIFRNTLLGALSITKELKLDEGSRLPEDKTFTLMILDSNGNPLPAGTDYSIGEDVFDIAEGGILHLAAGQTALIEKLEVGKTYSVTEDASSGHGFGIYYDPLEVTIAEKTDTTPSVALKVTNEELTVDLPISGTKILTNPNDAEHTYTFTLTEVDSEGNPLEDGVRQQVSTVWTEDDTVTEKTFAFPDALHYSGLDLKGQDSAKWYYQIAETGADSASLDKDERIYTLEVTVSLVPDGNTGRNKLTAERTGITAENGKVEEDSVIFSNTLLGELAITKELKLEEGSTVASDRTFTVYITDADGRPMPAGTPYTIGNTKYEVGPEGAVHIPGNKTAIIGNLVVGDTYSITEEPADAYGYAVSYDPDTVTIREKTKDVPNVRLKTVNKELTTDLEIPFAKTVRNPDGDKHTFDFRLTETDADGKPVSGGVSQKQSLKFKGKEDEGAFVLDYKGTMLEGYEEGVRLFYYLVEEATGDDGRTVDADETQYLVEVTLTGGRNALSAEITGIRKITGEKSEDTDAITFENTLLGSFTLTKKIIGSHPRGKTFEFTLKANLTGKWNAKLNGEDTTVTFENGVAKVKLGDQDELVIHGIPHGTGIYVKEKDDDYVVKITVNGRWRKVGAEIEETVTTDGLTIDYKNYSPDGLPQTGQLNWPIPILLAIAVLGIGGAILIIRKKGRYEE